MFSDVWFGQPAMAEMPQKKGYSISMTYKITTGKYYFL
jgi:hypothetical protein